MAIAKLANEVLEAIDQTLEINWPFRKGNNIIGVCNYTIIRNKNKFGTACEALLSAVSYFVQRDRNRVGHRTWTALEVLRCDGCHGLY